MDATLISPCHLLLPLASRYLHRRRPSGRKIPRGRGGGSPAGVTTWSWSGRNAGRSRVNSLLGDGGGGGDGFLPEKRILKLDSAIQKRSIRERLELVADKCSYFFTNIVPSIDVSQMSKGMLLLLHAMMVKHHVSFVLKPTEGEGFDLGMKWSLEWKDKKLPWDLDRNISTTHVYRGLLLISQVNKTCVPLLQMILQIIHQNLDAVILAVANKVLPESTLDERQNSTIVACVIIGLAIMVLFYTMFKNL